MVTEGMGVVFSYSLGPKRWVIDCTLDLGPDAPDSIFVSSTT